jgi:hypothetical protein
MRADGIDQSRLGLQRLAHGVHLAGPDRVQKCCNIRITRQVIARRGAALLRFDMRLHRAPTGKPVLPGQIELHFRELRIRRRGVPFLEALTRSLPQPVEIGT